MAGADLLERVRELCLAFPDVTEKVSHGAPAWFAKKKMFATFMNNHHGDGRIAIWCNAPPGAQHALVASDPTTYFVPPYVGVNGWLGMRLDKRPRWKEVGAVLANAYGASIAKKRAIV
jgi:hypothetical protein